MPIIEEVPDEDDIDNMHFDLGEFDPSNPFSRNMPVEEDAPVRLRTLQPEQQPQRAPEVPRPTPSPASPPLSSVMSSSPNIGPDPRLKQQSSVPPSRDIPEHMKKWSVLYPIYFDAARSSGEGRRVPKSEAVPNPLATTISEACRSLGFQSAFEVTKTHPNDWANPGRVRVNYSGSKRDLFSKICAYMKQNPTTEASARVNMYRQLATFDSPRALAVPRGMHFGPILPGVSPALSAQKVIEDSMKMDQTDMAKMFGM